jgi:hypothetical protein
MKQKAYSSVKYIHFKPVGQVAKLFSFSFEEEQSVSKEVVRE